MVELLLQAGATDDVTDENGWTALHHSASSEHASACVALLKAGAKIEARDKDGRTALHLSVLNGSSYTCEVLLQAGADFTVKDSFGASALDYATSNQDRDKAQLIRREMTIASGLKVKGLGTAVVAGLVQFFDFLSDIVVVAFWMGPRQSEMNERGLWWLGAAAIVFMLLSVLAGMALMTYAFTVGGGGERYSVPLRICLTVLLPLANLHVLFLGLDRQEGRGRQEFSFFMAKALETIMEAVPLSVLMVVDLVEAFASAGDGRPVEINLITASSLGLSVLSMAFGIGANAINRHRIKGGWMVSETFVLMLLDVVWFLAAVGICLASADLGVWHFAAPALALGLQCVGMAWRLYGGIKPFLLESVCGLKQGIRSGLDVELEVLILNCPRDLCTMMTYGCQAMALLILNLIFYCSTMLFVVGTVACMTVLGFPFATFDASYSTDYQQMYSPLFVVLRRISLFALSILGTVYLDSGSQWLILAILVFLVTALLHTLLSFRFYHNIGRIKFDIGEPLDSLAHMAKRRRGWGSSSDWRHW